MPFWWIKMTLLHAEQLTIFGVELDWIVSRKPQFEQFMKSGLGFWQICFFRCFSRLLLVENCWRQRTQLYFFESLWELCFVFVCLVKAPFVEKIRFSHSSHAYFSYSYFGLWACLIQRYRIVCWIFRICWFQMTWLVYEIFILWRLNKLVYTDRLNFKLWIMNIGYLISLISLI